MKYILVPFFMFCLSIFFLQAEELVDGKNPSVEYFTGLTEVELESNTLQLFDGRTFFGWEAIPVQKSVPVATPTPTIAISGGEMHLTTEIPIRLRTPILWLGSAAKPTSLNIVWKNEKGQASFESWNLLDEKCNIVKTHLLKDQTFSDKENSFHFQSTPEDGDNAVWFELVINRGSIAISSILYRPGFDENLFESKNGWKQPVGEQRLEIKKDSRNTVEYRLSGKGYLESQKSYANFIASVRYRTIVQENNRTKTFCNSGIFFRCMPESAMNGYECQINNNPNEEDRNRFLGNDTGGIFRRIAARRILDKDNEYAWVTVMANGLMIRTWVNGIPTVVWTDSRKADANPRKGARRQAGTLQIQGHDPWTTIEFDRFLLLGK